MVLLMMCVVTHNIKYLVQVLFIIVEVCIKFDAKLSNIGMLKCFLRLKVNVIYHVFAIL